MPIAGREARTRERASRAAQTGTGERKVKKKLVAVAALAALGVAAYLATQLWAQPPQPAPASPKIGLVNMFAVFKGYNKFKYYNDEVEKIRVDYQKKEDDLKKLIKDWTEFGNKGSQADREKAEETIKTCQRRIEDNLAEFKKVSRKKSDDQMVQMYNEIEEAVKTFGGPNGFHMILSYSEPLDLPDRNSASNIQRKLAGPGGSGGVCPLYFVSNMDVTADVVRALNTRFPSPAGTAVGGTVPPNH
jgi:Skp family chaperone for outer membrane proteins